MISNTSELHTPAASEEEAQAVAGDPLRAYDIVGDIHGCFDELQGLLERLGYAVAETGDEDRYRVTPPDGRTLVFLGDLVDRGPKIPHVLRLAMSAVEDGSAVCLLGNHDDKLMRWLTGHRVQIKHGLEDSVEQLEREPAAFRDRVARFLRGCEAHCLLEPGRLLVAHAGLKESLHGRRTERARDFALYGDVSGRTDEYGLPVRRDWAQEYRGRPAVVYGHTPNAAPRWVNNTINIDTGCVFGGWLTALRWPERELVSVPARRMYALSRRPFLPPDRLVEMERTLSPSLAA